MSVHVDRCDIWVARTFFGVWRQRSQAYRRTRLATEEQGSDNNLESTLNTPMGPQRADWRHVLKHAQFFCYILVPFVIIASFCCVISSLVACINQYSAAFIVVAGIFTTAIVGLFYLILLYAMVRVNCCNNIYHCSKPEYLDNLDNIDTAVTESTGLYSFSTFADKLYNNYFSQDE